VSRRPQRRTRPNRILTVPRSSDITPCGLKRRLLKTQHPYAHLTRALMVSAAQILGYYALTTDVEHGAAEGHFEQQQRTALADLATGGTIEIQKSIMARRLGIGRTTRDDVDVVV